MGTHMTTTALKVVIVGTAGCGKSSILGQLCDDEFTDDYKTTIGVDFRFKTMKVGDQMAKVQIWDTAGQERFRTITNSYYRNSHGTIIVFDITDRKTFVALNDWISEVRSHVTADTSLLIVGNKQDLNATRTVSYAEAEAFSQTHGAKYIETSAKENYNITEAFVMLVTTIFETEQPDAEEKGPHNKGIISAQRILESQNIFFDMIKLCC